MISKTNKTWTLEGAICLALTAAVCGIMPPDRAMAGAADEIHLAIAENEAIIHLVDARLALEKWHLRQLTRLQDQGHASWLEVERQQVAVDTLRSRQAARHQLATFLQALDRRLQQIGDDKTMAHRAETPDEPPMLILSLPGSLRVVGWLHASHVNSEIGAEVAATLRTSSPVDWEGRIDRALEKVALCRKRVDGLGTITGSPKAAADLEHAELELATARTELQLARVLQRGSGRERQRTESLQRALESPTAGSGTITGDSRSSFVTATRPQYITHRGCSALRKATFRVAAKEAASTGGVRAAETALKRLNRRLDQLRQLQADGVADSDEVETVREEVVSATSHLDQLRADRSSLEAACDLLRRAADTQDAQHDRCRNVAFCSGISARSSGNRLDAAWLPMSCLRVASAARHVIDLQRISCETRARRGALMAQLKLLEGLDARLEQAEMRLAEKQRQADGAPGSDDFRAALAAGRRREREDLGLEIQAINAQLLAADELLEVTCLETVRFAYQIAHQVKPENIRDTRFALAGDVPTAEGTGVAAVWLANWHKPAVRPVALDLAHGCWTTFSYIESLGALELCGPCDPGAPPWELADWPAAAGRSLAPAPYRLSAARKFAPGPWSAYDRLCDPLGACWGRLESARSLYPSDELPHLRRVSSRFHYRQPYHSPRYTDYYAFGIRRPDRPSRHGRATPYGGPWYYPGAPTNFRERWRQ